MSAQPFHLMSDITAQFFTLMTCLVIHCKHYGLMLPLILCLPIPIDSQALSRVHRWSDTRSLQLGGCATRGGGNRYCQRFVPNSFCSFLQDQCFCAKNYVSVYEPDISLACKPILSDLRCQADVDCTQFVNSVCHPGVGHCTCTTGSDLVVERAACSKVCYSRIPSLTYVQDPRVELEEKAPECQRCRQVGGWCYHLFDRPESDHSRTIQCACPNNKFTYALSRHDPSRQALCQGKLVGLGEVCDGRKVNCRPIGSVCSNKPVQMMSVIHAEQNEGYLDHVAIRDQENTFGKTVSPDLKSGRCICLHNYLPILQSVNGEIICQPSASQDDNLETCSICLASGGVCYVSRQRESDGLPLDYSCGCYASPDRSCGSSSVRSNPGPSAVLPGEPAQSPSVLLFESPAQPASLVPSQVLLDWQYARGQRESGVRSRLPVCSQSNVLVFCDRDWIQVCSTDQSSRDTDRYGLPQQSSSDFQSFILTSPSARRVQAQAHHPAHPAVSCRFIHELSAPLRAVAFSRWTQYSANATDRIRCSQLLRGKSKLNDCGIHILLYQNFSVYHGFALHSRQGRGTAFVGGIEFTCSSDRKSQSKVVRMRKASVYPDRKHVATGSLQFIHCVNDSLAAEIGNGDAVCLRISLSGDSRSGVERCVFQESYSTTEKSPKSAPLDGNQGYLVEHDSGIKMVKCVQFVQQPSTRTSTAITSLISQPFRVINAPSSGQLQVQCLLRLCNYENHCIPPLVSMTKVLYGQSKEVRNNSLCTPLKPSQHELREDRLEVREIPEFAIYSVFGASIKVNAEEGRDTTLATRLRSERVEEVNLFEETSTFSDHNRSSLTEKDHSGRMPSRILLWTFAGTLLVFITFACQPILVRLRGAGGQDQAPLPTPVPEMRIPDFPIIENKLPDQFCDPPASCPNTGGCCQNARQKLHSSIWNTIARSGEPVERKRFTAAIMYNYPACPLGNSCSRKSCQCPNTESGQWNNRVALSTNLTQQKLSGWTTADIQMRDACASPYSRNVSVNKSENSTNCLAGEEATHLVTRSSQT